MNRKNFEADIESPVAKRQKTSACIDRPVAVQRPSKDIFGLNGDCLRQIFKYCSCADLFQLCVADKKLKTTVLEYGIATKIIDFSELVNFPISDVFKIFGDKMTKIKIAEQNVVNQKENVSKFEEILQLISTHCPMDKLKYLNLQYDYGTSINKRYLYAVLPFLRNIESFVISESVVNVGPRRFCCYRHMLHRLNFHPTVVNDFIDSIVANAVTIKSIEIRNVQFTGTFFYLQHVLNLETLALDVCHICEPDSFISLMNQKPKLKSFSWIHSYARRMTSSLSIAELVVNSLPDLESFHYHPVYGRGAIDAIEDPFLNINYENLINKSKHLKVLTINEFDYNILDTLVQKNSVQELRVFGTCGYIVDKSLNICNYRELKCIKVKVTDR